MIDPRPIGYLTGLLVAFLGVAMFVPFAVDLYLGNGNAGGFLESAILTTLVGTIMAIACANSVKGGLKVQQIFLMTTGVWAILPVFGAIPFVQGASQSTLVDAYFEAMSGLTTTGSTVFSGLDDMPAGLLLWRSMLQWFGGIGIIVVAMAFLPELRVGGMQIFRSEGFDTDGKVLPRAAEIASRISIIYFALTLGCFLAYLATGMGGFDAVNHALTTIATGGFSTKDASFGAFSSGAQMVAVLFMILASLPFVRYVQLLAGTAGPMVRDSQILTFVWTLLAIVVVMSMFRFTSEANVTLDMLRDVLFNLTSITTGTGYASLDYQLWGAFPITVFFFAGLIGGCAGSTTCSVKIFRYQILFVAVTNQIKKIHSPHGIFKHKYQGKTLAEDVVSSVMAFLTLFFVTLGVISVLLSATGLDFVTSVSGAATAIANVGPGLGDVIGPSGNFGDLNTPAKWILSVAMLVGRLELMVVFVLFTRRFWNV